MGAVPRPPADLLARIKADIPEHLEAQPEPPRRAISMALYMRVAAMLILMFTTGLITLRVLQDDPASTSVMHDRRVFPALERAAAKPASQAAAPVEAVHLEITEALPAPEALVAATTRPIVQTTARTTAQTTAQAAPPAARATDLREERDASTDVASFADASGQVVPDTGAQNAAVGAVASRAASPADEAEVAPRVAAAAPPPPPATESFSIATATAAEPESITVTASAPAVMSQPTGIASRNRTQQTALAAAPPHAVPAAPTRFFGISVDPDAFAFARAAVERGQLARNERIDLEAIVNYFAGPATKPPRSGVRLDVELSPAPLSVPGDRAYLRLSVDTPRTENGSVPVAQNVDVRIELDDDAVSSWRRIGGDASILAEPLLRSNVAVTLLYELDLRAPLQASSKIAHVELKYRNVGDRKRESSEMTLRARDIVTQWSNASRRHRLATLGALWGEGLVDHKSAPELAKKAQELAEQAPRDVRARELANAASASAGGSRF